MRRKSDENQLILALQAMEKDTALSIRAAAKIYSINHSTLARRRRGQTFRRDSIPNLQKLTDLEESMIIQYILDLDARSFPPRLCSVEDMANRLLADRDAPPVGVRWASNFVKRYLDLKMRFFWKYDYQRAKCEDPTIIRKWFTLVANIIAKYGI